MEVLFGIECPRISFSSLDGADFGKVSEIIRPFIRQARFLLQGAHAPIIRSKARYGSAAGNCSACFIMASLEHFRNAYRLLNVLEGGFSLRKKPLSITASVYTNSYKALGLSRMTFSATGSFPEARGSEKARSGADSLLGTLPLKVVSAKVQGK
jgi:hypothetical protein